MDHDRAVPLVVLAGVLHVEALGQREVALHGGQLPQAADRVAEVEVDLRSVERRPRPRPPCTASRCCRGPSRSASVAPRPHRPRPDRLPGLRRQVHDGVAEPERRVDLERQLEHLEDLVDQLVGRADDVRVVLGAAADAEQPVQRTQAARAGRSVPSSDSRIGRSRYERVCDL